MTDLIWSFSPWLLFLLATRFTSFSGAVQGGGRAGGPGAEPAAPPVTG